MEFVRFIQLWKLLWGPLQRPHDKYLRRECDAEPAVGAGMVDIRMDETVTNIRDTSSSQAGWRPSPLPFNTTAAVQPETKHMTSVSALSDPRTGADSMNLPDAVQLNFLDCHWLHSSPQTRQNIEHPDYWNTSLWITITTLKLQHSILVLLLIAVWGGVAANSCSRASLSTFKYL